MLELKPERLFIFISLGEREALISFIKFGLKMKLPEL